MPEKIVMLATSQVIRDALEQAAPTEVKIDYALDADEGQNIDTVSNALDMFRPSTFLVVLKDIEDIINYYSVIHQVRQTNSSRELKILLVSPRPERRNQVDIINDFINLIKKDKIYPLFVNQINNVSYVYEHLHRPPVYEDVSFVISLGQDKEDEPQALSIQVPNNNYKNGYIKSSLGVDNLIMFSSIKPGSGKSTVSVNYAIIVAKYGYKIEQNMQKPLKVLLVEGDYQNYSVGTMLGLEDKVEQNIFTAFEQLSDLRSDSTLSTDEFNTKLDELLSHQVRSYSKVKNLDTLTVPDFTLNLESYSFFNQKNYKTLFQWACEHYDAVIVDTNSRIEDHISIPLMQMSSIIYEIINLDFNNILNTTRNANRLNDLEVLGKTKFILNQDMDNEYYHFTIKDDSPLTFTETDLEEEVGIKISGKISAIPMSTMLNCLSAGEPLVLHDDNPIVIYPKLQFLQLANEDFKINENEEYSLRSKWHDFNTNADKASQTNKTNSTTTKKTVRKRVPRKRSTTKTKKDSHAVKESQEDSQHE